MERFTRQMEKFNVRELEFCGGCEAGPCFDCSQESIAESEAGQKLEEIGVRYGRFAWDDQDKFKHFLGEDVDPVRHGLYQARYVAMPLIEAQNASDKQHFNKRQAKNLLITNIYHDAHEGYTGDIPYPDKTRESDIAELQVNQRVLGALGVSQVMAQNIGKIMGDFDKRTFVGKAFNLVEKIGYMETGLRAWSLKDHPLLDLDEQSMAWQMGAEVTPGAASAVAQEQKRFPYAQEVLLKNSVALQEIKECNS